MPISSREDFVNGLLRPKWGGSIAAMRKFLEETRATALIDEDLSALEALLPYAIADSYAISNQRRQATQYFDEAISYRSNWRFSFESGKNFLAMGDYGRALDSLNRALELRPQVANVLSARGRAHQRLASLNQAYQDFSMALKLDGYNPRILYEMSSLMSDMRRYTEAVEALDRALVHGRFDPRIWLLRGFLRQIYFREFDKGLGDYWRALLADPMNPVCRLVLVLALCIRMIISVMQAAAPFLLLPIHFPYHSFT